MDILAPFYGRIVKNYGEVSRRPAALFSVTVSATLRVRRGEPLLLLSERWTGLGVSIRWMVLEQDGMSRLLQVLEDARDTGPSRDIERR